MSSKLAQRCVVAALVLAAVAGALAIHLVSSDRLEDQRADRISDARREITDALAGRQFYLEDVADMIGVHDDADLREFSRYARVRGERESSLVAVQWLRRSPDDQLVTPRDIGVDPLLVSPDSGADGDLALADHQAAARTAIRRASLAKRPAVSPPLQLSNGDTAFYLAVPVDAHRYSGEVSRVESQSVIVGLVDAKRLLAQQFGPSPVPVSVSDQSGTLASIGDVDNPTTDTIPARGRTWVVTVEGGSISSFETLLPWLVLFSGFALALVVAVLLARAVSRRDAALAVAHEREAELERRSREDALTGIFNRRHFTEVLAAELADPGHEAMTAVFLLDLDHFKRINDRHGHLTGDLVLQVAAQRLASVLRPTETLSRWGGEEFAVLAGGLDRAGAAALGERLRSSISDAPVEIKGDLVHLTVSVGIALVADGLDDPDAIVDAADNALYEAKDAGRNIVCIWSGRERAPKSAPLGEDASG
jgi:diguanylate cyclase (GGDEF)-like protein